MGWIFSSLTEVLISVVGKIIEFFFGAFDSLSLDIGYDKSDFTFGKLFSLSYYKNASGLLDRIFPAAGSFLPLFMYLGMAIVFGILVFKILQSMFDVTGKNSEHPVMVIAMSILASILVTYSYTIFIMVEVIGNSFYEPFREVLQRDVIGSYSLSNVWDYLINPSSLFDETLRNEVGSLAINIIALVLLIALLTQFIRLVLEAFERYVVLGLMFYTSPLAFACTASQGSRKIFSSWAQMLLSQFLLMIINLFFLGVFYAGFAVVFSPGEISFANVNGDVVMVSSKEYVFASATDFVVKMFVLIGWLTVGQKVDQHLRSLGLSVSQTGAGLGSAVLTGAAGALKAIQTGARLAKNTVKAASDIREGIAEGRLTAARNDATAGESKLAPGLSVGEAIENLYTSSDGSGHLKGSAVDAAMNMPLSQDGSPITIGGAAGRDVFDELEGVNGASMNNTVMDDAGVFWPTAPIASAVISDHKVTGLDSEGDSIVEYGNANDWHAVDSHGNSAASFIFSHGDANYVQGATQGHIDHGAFEMGRSLTSIPLDNSVESKISGGWQSEYETRPDGRHVPTGVYTAKDAKGKELARWMPVKEKAADGSVRNLGSYACVSSDGRMLAQASLDGVVDLDKGKGEIVSAHNNSIKGDTGFTFSVQNLAGSNNLHSNVSLDVSSNNYAVYESVSDKAFDPYERVKPAASGKLEKHSKEMREYGYSQTGRAERKEVAALNEARLTENKMTQLGRVLNNLEGKSTVDKLKELF